MAVIHYLNWDQETKEHGPATELFHQLSVKQVLEPGEQPSDKLSEEEFNQLYRELVEVDVEKPEQVFREWNRGSGEENPRFLGLRYCKKCGSYIEGVGETVVHAVQNHGYNADNDFDEPRYVRGVRSFSVGDVVEFNDSYHRCENIGWTEIEVF